MTTQPAPRDVRTPARFRLPRPSGAVLAVLLPVDLALIAASVATHRAGSGTPEASEIWSVENDSGLAELVGHVHLLALAVLLLTLWRLGGRPVWIAWAALFALALADDRYRLHENQGHRLADLLHLPRELAGLRAGDLGELVVWGLLAVLPLLAIGGLHLRSDPRTRRESLGLGLLVAVYVFFGVVVDQLHAMSRGGAGEHLLGTIEDGGELLTLTVVLAHVVVLVGTARRNRRPADRGGSAQEPVRRRASASSSPA
ncbi:hypothetical protein [Trujillonella endophytica]|uniref:Uncharacterized protein n=1 Tax=Trujillonella endophytica TaxID=673521 RepID=A0A1H8SKG1_9ACTN|nr:hypothetical protein [Trujillella endophytica]SEO79055.1 hypothetical protein SAMN05660991_01788 [Trujillella endophytica]